MDPLTIMALVTAAGFIFRKVSSQAKLNDEDNCQELTYSKDIVSRSTHAKKAEFDVQSIEVLPEYVLVKKLVDQKFPLIFVTGGAGTGKSTFIRWLISEFSGSVLLGAPTAIAAINIGGKTLHSICQLPPSFIIKDDIKEVPRRKEVTEAKLLIIDEISMVNANLLDGVSAFFRRNRKVDKPFGGVPVIMIGDMFQLPPVVSRSTEKFFKQIYGSAKFYNAKCLGEAPYYGVELKKTFRQTDQQFVDLLTKLREGVDLEKVISDLNSACIITDTPIKGAVWLSPRNSEVDTRNLNELAKLGGEVTTYHGTIRGNFKPGRLPSPMHLKLKKGAQVMFTQNNSQGLWINGSTGIVMEMDPEKIMVKMIESDNVVDVFQSQWNEYRYKWNNRTNEIDREKTGEFRQFPLVLAWAVTIHKSQGKTIEKVHLDLGSGAFESGQTYVALSRAKTIEGLSFTRPLSVSDVIVDEESKAFYYHLREVIRNLPPEKMLENLADDMNEIDYI